MKTNRPTGAHGNGSTTSDWYDLGYQDAVLDAKEKLSTDQKFYMDMYDIGSTRTSTSYDKGWIEARDDMETVMEIVHFCLKNDRPGFGQLIIEKYMTCKVNNDE